MKKVNEHSPIGFLRALALLFAIFSCHSAYMTIVSFSEFQENALEVSKFICISSSVKFLIFTILSTVLIVPIKPFIHLIGDKPYHITNTSLICLLLFVVISPILLHFTNRPYDLVSDGTLLIIYHGYIPVAFLLWLVSAILVITKWKMKTGIGYRPKFWVASLIVAPVYALLAKMV
jgi:hypothetical protein